MVEFSLIRLKYRFSPFSNWPKLRVDLIRWSTDAPYTRRPPPSLPPGDTCYTLVRGFQGLRRKELVIFPHWWPPNGSPTPPAWSNWGFSLPVMLSGSGFRKKRSADPLPNHTVQRSSAALFPVQEPTPPLLTAGSSQRRKILPMSCPALRK